MNRPGFPWFKMYAEARTDKKLGLLSMAERGCWLNLLCYASEQDQRGAFDVCDRELLAIECADGDEELLNSTIAKLLKIKHLVTVVTMPVTSDVTSVTSSNDYMTLQFRTFDARQAQKVSNFPSDDKERVRERVRKHRASGEHVTSVTTRNGRNDTDREEERDSSNSSVSTSGEVSSRERVQPAEGEPLTRTRARSLAEQNHSAEPESAPPPKKKPANRPADPKEPRPRAANPLWDVLVETFYEPTTPDERKLFGKIVHDLKESRASPDDVRARVRRHAKTQSHWTLTPRALITHWSELGMEGNHHGATGALDRRLAAEAAHEDYRAQVYAEMVRDERERAAGERLPRKVS